MLRALEEVSGHEPLFPDSSYVSLKAALRNVPDVLWSILYLWRRKNLKNYFPL